jgi:hypothetical protein
MSWPRFVSNQIVCSQWSVWSTVSSGFFFFLVFSYWLPFRTDCVGATGHRFHRHSFGGVLGKHIQSNLRTGH